MLRSKRKRKILARARKERASKELLGFHLLITIPQGGKPTQALFTSSPVTIGFSYIAIRAMIAIVVNKAVCVVQRRVLPSGIMMTAERVRFLRHVLEHVHATRTDGAQRRFTNAACRGHR
jgi:hypothetical protein